MLADEADNPGFLLLLEQVVLFVVMIMMALVIGDHDGGLDRGKLKG